MSSYSTIQDHRSMVFDDLRNAFYSEAIKQAVKTGSTVLDLGAGLGIHGFMAAYQGARKVYLVDPEPIIDVTREVASINGLSERVECIAGKIEDVELPEKVDVIISVLTGNFLLTEDLLPALFYARDRYLAPGGKLIPDRATMEVVPVSAPEYYEKNIACWNRSFQEVAYDHVRGLAANSLYYGGPGKRSAEFLSDPVELMKLDFTTAKDASCQEKVEVKVDQSGLCHGWLGWFQMRLGTEWLSTSPVEKQTHWRQVFLPLAEPLSLQKGDSLSFELNRPDYGEWTWVVGHEGKYQRQSTFFSQAISPASLLKRSDAYTPRVSVKGKVAQQVLLLLDGSASTAEVVDCIMLEYKDIFANRSDADQFVKDLVERYAS